MRKPHMLKRNARGELPHYLVFVDTETDSIEIDGKTVEARLKFGWAYYTRYYGDGKWGKGEWFRFGKRRQFWAWLESKVSGGHKLYCYAHNWSFDFSVLGGFQALRRRGFELYRAIIESPPLVLHWRRNRRSIVFIDTLNYFKVPLAALGQAISAPKLPMPARNDSAEVWDAYCTNDVNVIYQAIKTFITFIESNDLGNYQPTLASQSFTAYRHRFMQAPIYIDDNIKALTLARRGYYGGRTEAFYIGHTMDETYCLDINSQYPYVMATNEYPTKLLTYLTNPSKAEVTSWLNKWAMMADVTVESGVPAFPLRLDGRLIFPVGTFRTVLSTPEIAYLLHRNMNVQFHATALYEQGKIFDRFVDFFYLARRKFADEGNAPFAYMCKILMNSLYGKFGQSGRHYEFAGRIDGDAVETWREWDDNTQQTYHWRKFAGIVQAMSHDGESRDSHPAIAAHVTAYARMLLWEMMNTAGRNHVIYVDTDSLWVDQWGRGKLQSKIDATKLGALKVEWKSCDVAIYGAKDYAVDGNEKIKGVRHSARKLAPGVYLQPTFVSLRGAIRAGYVDRQIIRDTEKHLTRQYKKGIVDSAGKVTPLNVGNKTKG